MHLKTRREYLREMVASKNHWSNRELTDEERSLGFLGWHERGYLPHCDFPNLVQFVTFRLEDSMPTTQQAEWKHLLKIENVRERRTQLEDYLDKGIGKCWLRDKRIAKMTERALLHFHNNRYELLAWCVMPNHVHVLVNVRMTPLGKILQSWKRFTATRAEPILLERRSPTRLVPVDVIEPGRRPAFRLQWQRECWDTFMRDSEQERKAVRYIENNPVKAGLCQIPEEWAFSSARFRDEFRRLEIPTKENI